MTTPWTGIPILSALGAEVAILFSVLSLINRVEKKWFLLAIAAITLITVLFEVIRSAVHPRTIILMLSVCLTIIFTINYLICRFRLSTALSKNQFMKWFTWFELGMVGYGLVRILGYFSSEPIRPWDTPSTLALIVFSFYVVMGTFRYISYIGLRITWVSPINATHNSLNRPLAQAIEEKDQLLRGLIASNRVIGISALASSLAHQLSQPLTTIALRADTVRRDLAKPTQSQNIIPALDEISTQSTKLSELVKNLRRLFGSRNHQFEAVNLQKITNEIIEIVEPSLEGKGIILKKLFQDDPIVYGDGIQLQQVLINVFNNAIDALSQPQVSKREISISLTTDEKFATLSIKDTGKGINKQLLPTIFDLYKTTKQGGLGVGLWLSKTIMDRHHGNITAHNDDSGGAIFNIDIPLYQNQNK